MPNVVAADKKEPAEEDDSEDITDEQLLQLIGFKCFLPQSLLVLYLLCCSVFSFLTSFNFVFLQ